MLEQECVTVILLLYFLLVVNRISAGAERVLQALKGTSSTANPARRKVSQLLSAFLASIHVNSPGRPMGTIHRVRA